ncbi:hypothetical protein Intca_2960 [Intrasporangium calvum DSM 43043]|uniref:Uncharacterized protein n=1 Tax=Intrasporangium calvum (strain ATCC 23552 / DSM 43043 / JCM 3097 / NBRC 12989 / NCIMB 10167 / NRRL B-3866 / 7 KIP) TaxID=710696 RepID=E6SAZ4_INTC7|nr:hypothetical protein Intca_2960 [Intrasporangium calvum DSM 43043]
MAADAERAPDPPLVPSWSPFERGPFMFGRCDLCGFETPARRASYSVEMDMTSHAVLCHSTPPAVADIEVTGSESEPATLDR